MPSERWMPMRRGGPWHDFLDMASDEPELLEVLQHLKFPDVEARAQETDVLASIRIEEV